MASNIRKLDNSPDPILYLFQFLVGHDHKDSASLGNQGEDHQCKTDDEGVNSGHAQKVGVLSKVPEIGKTKKGGTSTRNLEEHKLTHFHDRCFAFDCYDEQTHEAKDGPDRR